MNRMNVMHTAGVTGSAHPRGESAQCAPQTAAPGGSGSAGCDRADEGTDL
ncbi:hypothetical protein GCM10028832_39860 [Streptomyces sparsus]